MAFGCADQEWDVWSPSGPISATTENVYFLWLDRNQQQ